MSALAEAFAAPLPQTELTLKVGQGNWRAFQRSGFTLDQVLECVSEWAVPFAGINKPWLCWNVDSDWCLTQQKLARHADWTPVVGYDPRVGPPRETVPGAVVVNFNERLQLPILYPHFVMEFAFLLAPRLAFWHSDLLVRLPLLEKIASGFDALEDGETTVTRSNPGLRHALQKKYQRYWELIGCTTRAASKRQFDTGTGWWMGFPYHPNCPDERERQIRSKYYWDHGTGIYYWHQRCGGRVNVIRGSAIHEGHCTKIGNPKYKRAVPMNSFDAHRNMASELTRNFDLADVCKRMELSSVCD